jgi:hypothetical protein
MFYKFLRKKIFVLISKKCYGLNYIHFKRFLDKELSKMRQN